MADPLPPALGGGGRGSARQRSFSSSSGESAGMSATPPLWLRERWDTAAKSRPCAEATSLQAKRRSAGGILSRLPGPGVRWRPAGVGLALVAPAASEVGRQPLKGLRRPAGVPNTMALAVL